MKVGSASVEFQDLERERDEAREQLDIVTAQRDAWALKCEKRHIAQLERERDEARSQRNALAASLEYIASAGLTARHCEDEAKKMLALVFEKEDGQ